MSRPHRSRGLAARFFLAQLLVVTASILSAVLVALIIGPPVFHEHLLRADVAPDPSQVLHVENAYRDANLWALGAGLATALTLATAVAWFFARRIRRPLDALTSAAASMATGRYSTRVPATGAGAEVDAVSAAFNTMAEQLDGTERTRRRLISDLAHEMRTPVSVLTVYLDALHDGVTEWNAATGTVMADQLARLARLIEDMHEVSRAEEGHLELDPARQGIAPLAHAAAEAHREAFIAKGVDLVVEVRHESFVIADRDRIGQVLDNLLTNALRHTPAGGRVVLSTDLDSTGRANISVADTGDGIDPEQLPHVFERFYRGDSARNRDHGGSGVGLAISRALVEAHGGALTARSDGTGRGAVFTLTLSLSPDSTRGEPRAAISCNIPLGGIYREGQASPGDLRGDHLEESGNDRR
jgi:two-component system sensor histidine kinase BaeS